MTTEIITKISQKEKRDILVKEVADNLSFELLAQEYGKVEAEQKKLKESRDTLHDAILLKFEKSFGHESRTFTNPETGETLQRVLRVTQTVIQSEAKKVMTPSELAYVTVTTVDLDKLLAAIKVGLIKPMNVAAALNDKESDSLTYKRLVV